MPQTTQLPEITLECRDGHSFRTRARGGQPIKCPKCRVSVWVPKSRPVDGSGAASSGGSALAGRWLMEGEPDTSALVQPSGIPCPQCGRDLLWEPGRTLLLCVTCKDVALPPSIPEHYRRAELAARPAAAVDRAETLKAEVIKRMEFSQKRDKAVRAVNSWLRVVDPDALPAGSGLSELAVELDSNLRHMVRELGKAENGAELSAAVSVANELIEVVRSYRDRFDAEHERAEREESEPDDDDDDDDDEYDDEPEDDEPAAEYRPDWLNGYGHRQPYYTPDQKRLIQVPRQQITTPGALVPLHRNAVPANPYLGLAADMAKMAERRQAIKWCAFDHFFKTRATYQYHGAVSPGGVRLQNSPVVLCCEKHRDNAEKWIGSHGWQNSTYQVLEN